MKTLQAILKKIQAIVAKEFLWVLAAAILAAPLAVMLGYLCLQLEANEAWYLAMKAELKNSESLLYFYFYALSLLTVYLVRMVKGAIQTLIPKS